jgi:hypothetical protein
VANAGKWAYDRVLSPTYAAVRDYSPIIGRFTRDRVLSPAFRGVVSGARATGRAAKAVGKGSKWTYRNVLSPTYTRVAPIVHKIVKDYIIPPTYAAAKAAGKKIYSRASKDARRFHEYMMQEPDPEEEEENPAPRKRSAPEKPKASAAAPKHEKSSAAPEHKKPFVAPEYKKPPVVPKGKVYEEIPTPKGDSHTSYQHAGATGGDVVCAHPYDKTNATKTARLKACVRGGTPHPNFVGQSWQGRPNCIEKCFY